VSILNDEMFNALHTHSRQMFAFIKIRNAKKYRTKIYLYFVPIAPMTSNVLHHQLERV